MCIKCYHRAWHCEVGDMGEDKVSVQESNSSVLSGFASPEFLILFLVDGKEINILIFSCIYLPMGRVLVIKIYIIKNTHTLLIVHFIFL